LATVLRHWRSKGAVARHDHTNSQRQRRKRDRLAARGLTQCNVWVPASALPDIRLPAELLRQHPHLVPGSLRDLVSGKFVALRHVRSAKDDATVTMRVRGGDDG
jgi:hypothetical protein